MVKRKAVLLLLKSNESVGVRSHFYSTSSRYNSYILPSIYLEGHLVTVRKPHKTMSRIGSDRTMYTRCVRMNKVEKRYRMNRNLINVISKGEGVILINRYNKREGPSEKCGKGGVNCKCVNTLESNSHFMNPFLTDGIQIS